MNGRLWSLPETAGDMSGGEKDRAESRVEGAADERTGTHAPFQQSLLPIEATGMTLRHTCRWETNSLASCGAHTCHHGTRETEAAELDLKSAWAAE